MKKAIYILTFLILISIAFALPIAQQQLNENSDENINLNTLWFAGTFPAHDSYYLQVVEVDLDVAGGSPTGTINCSIWSLTNASPRKPNQLIAQATNTVNKATVNGNNVNFTFTVGSVYIEAGRNYSISLGSSSYDGSHYNSIRAHTTANNGSTFVATSDPASWNLQNNPRPIKYTLYASSGNPDFASPTPADGTHNNTLGSIINATCSGPADVTLFFDTNLNPKTNVTFGPTHQNYSLNTDTIPATGTYYYKANCNGINSSVRSWTYDTDAPTITLNKENFFTSTGNQTIQKYNDYQFFNITFQDNQDLYAFEINISIGANKYYGFSNTTISGTSYTFEKSINTSNWPANNTPYNISIRVTDSHTANKIDDYKVKKEKNKLTYDTAEGNSIEIISNDNADTDTDKYQDRYDFSFDFDDGLTKDRTFTIKCDNPLSKRNTDYEGHFVCANGINGNWIDFEGMSQNPIIEKISDYEYRVTFKNVPDKINFNSIGGLNMYESSYVWYKGFKSTTASSNYSNSLSTIMLNISRDLAYKVEADLNYNGTVYTSTTNITYSDFFYIEQEVTTPDIDTNKNISYYWNISLTYPDGNVSNIEIHANHSLYVWGLDNCSNSNYTAFYFNIYDERDLTELNANVSFSLDYYQEGYPTLTKQYQVTRKDNHTYRFCKFPGNVTFYGDITGIMEAPSYGPRTYFRYDIILDGYLNGYLLNEEDSGETIIFGLIDSSSDPIENALMTAYRTINGSNEIIYQGVSDFAGQVNIFLDQTYTYYFTINASGFPFKSFNLQPTATEYTLRLSTGGTNFYDNLYSGLRFRLIHNGRIGLPSIWNVTDNYQNLSFQVEGTDLQEIGINLSNHNYLCKPSSCVNISNNPNGGIVTVSILVNETGTFNGAFYFQKTGAERIYVNDILIKGVPFVYQGVNSFIDFITEFKENTSPNTRTIFAGFVSVGAIGIGASIGLFGVLLIIPVVLANIIMSLPGIELINPLVGMFITIFGVVVFIFNNIGK